MKMKKSNYSDALPQLKLGMIKVPEHAIYFENVAIVDDNLDCDSDGQKENTGQERPIPLKILIAISLICVEGSIDIKINQTEYHLVKNDILLGMPGFIIEDIKFSGNYKAIMIATSKDFLGKSPLKGAETARKWLLQKGSPTTIHLPQRYCDIFLDNYRCFKKSYAIAEPDYRVEVLISFMYTLFALLSSFIVNSGIPDYSVTIPRKKDIMLRFLNDVHVHCGRERSVTFYAEQCCLSPKYFARIITETLGKKPGDIIKENVIVEAKVMLATKSYTIQEVCNKLNFPNASFFCKYFKSATGCSPRHYQIYGEHGKKEDKD